MHSPRSPTMCVKTLLSAATSFSPRATTSESKWSWSINPDFARQMFNRMCGLHRAAFWETQDWENLKRARAAKAEKRRRRKLEGWQRAELARHTHARRSARGAPAGETAAAEVTTVRVSTYRIIYWSDGTRRITFSEPNPTASD